MLDLDIDVVAEQRFRDWVEYYTYPRGPLVFRFGLWPFNDWFTYVVYPQEKSNG